jgi:hypothetical protein
VSERRLRSFWILFAAWLVLMLYAFPGYMNWDADEQLFQGRTGTVTDWHPPVMATYWGVIDLFVRGPLGMLLLQSILFLWGMFRVLCQRMSERAAAWTAAALLVFPPILTPMAVTWKDAQMAAFLAAGLALALDPRRWRRGVGLALLVLAAAVRDNGAFALPPLCIVIVATWRALPRWKVVGLAAVLTVGITGGAMLANQLVPHDRSYAWYKTVAIHDIAGAICHDDSISDDEIQTLVGDTGLVAHPATRAVMCSEYTPRKWFDLEFSGDRSAFSSAPTKAQRLARRTAWFRVVREHPGAWLAHRVDVMAEVLGLSDADMWEPVCQTFASNEEHLRRISHDASLSWIQSHLGDLFRALGKTMLFRPWWYAMLSLIFLGWGLVKRERLVAALAGSGLCYEASYFLFSAAPDYRYSHWMIVCCVLSAALIVVERLRSRSA